MNLNSAMNKRPVLGNVFIPIILIIALGFIAYGNAFNGAFIWDDNGLITNNALIKSWSNIKDVFRGDLVLEGVEWKFYRPLQLITYIIDHSLWELNVKGYHLTNILLHICAALGIFRLIDIIFKDKLLSLLTGLLYVVHPVHTEAVAYIAGRADSLALLFMLVSFLLYIKGHSSKNFGTFILMLISYAAALLSRESAIILPALIWLYHYSFKKEFKGKEFPALSGLALLYIVLRVVLIKTSASNIAYTTTFAQRIPGFFVALTNYVRLLFLPLNLHMEYGSKVQSWSDPKAILGIIILFSSIILAYRKRESDRLVFFSIAWFYITLLPVANLYPINAYMAEHWLYVPSIGFFLIAARTARPLIAKENTRLHTILFIVCILGYYTFLTIKQNAYWKDPISFYKRTLQYAPQSVTMYNNLGYALMAEGKPEESIAAFEKAIENKPYFAKAHYNLGNAYKIVGEDTKAIESYRNAIDKKKDYADAYYNLGVVYKNAGRNVEAINVLKEAINIKGNFAEAYNNLGGAYLALGKEEEAAASFRKAVEIKPDHANAYYNLGVVYNALNKKEEAIAAFKEAIEIEAGDAYAYANLANIYFEKMEYKSALEYYDRAKALGFDDQGLQEKLKPYR